MSLKKQFLKNESECKVTFRFLKDGHTSVDTVKLVGDFNQWDQMCAPMKKLKNGDFTQIVKLNTNEEYQFKYLINDEIWVNDVEADKFVPNGIEEGNFNSVVVL